MDTTKVHNSKQAFPAMVKYLANCGGDFPSDTEQAQLLYWYVTSSIWGRFSGPTETIINQDLAALKSGNPIAALHENLRQDLGDRKVQPDNFDFNRTNTRIYPLLHMMSRVWGARDWGTGRLLTSHEPGDGTALELHHIFPKKVLRDYGIPAHEHSNLGNLAFQTRDTNRGIKDREPTDYMAAISERQPDALESQWVPNDPELWRLENYQRFLIERRALLAKAANDFLETLRAGILPSAALGAVSASLDAEEEEAILDELNSWVTAQGLSEGKQGYEIIGEKNGELIAILDLAWPNGLQDGLSEPVAVLIDEGHSVRKAANNAGFRRLFAETTALDDFRRYVRYEILGLEEGSEGEEV